MKTLCTLMLILFIRLGGFAQAPQIMWYFDVHDSSFGNSALADLDNDGKPEIAFSNYRNDSNIYVLNAENGSLLWKYNTGGCNDVAPLIMDTDGDGDLEIILPSSCVAKTFCFDGDSGYVEWVANTRGSDSPPTTADIDNDDKPEILHGEFGGWVMCLNAEDGSQAWELPVDMNSWIQTAPAIMDVDNNGQLDFVVANWSFGTDHRIWAFRGDNQQQIWDSQVPNDYIYHGTAFADIDKDGYNELSVGDYEGNLICLNAENGSLKWGFAYPDSGYIGAPTSMGDLDLDGWIDIVFISYRKVGAIDHTGTLKWTYIIPNYGQSFRGAALADMNADDTLDVVFGTSTGHLMVLNGARGNLLFDVDLATHYGSNDFDIDHCPVIADFDNDGDLDAFLVGGHTEYPAIQNNWGRGYAVSFPSSVSTGTPPWPMFRHDQRRSGCANGFLTGIEEGHAPVDAIRIFPNPSSGLVQIRLEGEMAGPIQISVMDLLGKSIPANCEYRDDGADLRMETKGVYFVQVTIGKRVYWEKVIIE